MSLQSELNYYRDTLKVIAHVYSHTKDGNDPTCSCAACVADRAVKMFDKRREAES